MTYDEAIDITGGLSNTSKMPGYSWSIPAWKCIMGSKLRKVKDSVCSRCYALRGNYLYPAVKNKMEKRLQGISHPEWVDGMVYLIDLATHGKYPEKKKTKKSSTKYFRFFDSGDLQSLEHLEKIVEIAQRLPNIKMWLPTREWKFIGEYYNLHGEFPKNLIVRLSAHMINVKPPITLANQWKVETSSVHNKGTPVIGAIVCRARERGNECGPCRACWNPNVMEVSYPLH